MRCYHVVMRHDIGHRRMMLAAYDIGRSVDPVLAEPPTSPNVTTVMPVGPDDCANDYDLADVTPDAAPESVPRSRKIIEAEDVLDDLPYDHVGPRVRTTALPPQLPLQETRETAYQTSILAG